MCVCVPSRFFQLLKNKKSDSNKIAVSVCFSFQATSSNKNKLLEEQKIIVKCFFARAQSPIFQCVCVCVQFKNKIEQQTIKNNKE